MLKERPIIFSGPMVRAIMEGRKTQTRRVVKNPEWYGCPTGDCPHQTQYECDQAMNDPSVLADCPYGEPGDRLWVKSQHWHKPVSDLCPERIWCDEDELLRSRDYTGPYEDRRCGFESLSSDFRKRPSIFMPRWASRLTLEVVNVRVERLQAISEADKLAEGATPEVPFGTVWRKINIKPGIRWEDNPWVRVVEFKKLEAP